MEHRQFLEDWFRRVWTEEDTGIIDERLAPDVKIRGFGAHVNSGPEDFKPFHRALLALIGDMEIDIDRYLSDGDWAHALITVRARARKDGTPVEFAAQVLLRIADGRIVEGYNSVDFIGLFEQLGLMPPDAFERCLGGRHVC